MTTEMTTAPANADNTEEAVADYLPILPNSPIRLEARHKMIAEAAYFLAAERGFVPGNEFDDWLAAETAIDHDNVSPTSG